MEMPLSKVSLMCLETSSIIKYQMKIYESEKNIIMPKPKDEYAATFDRMRQNTTTFFRYLSVSLETFDYILEHVRKELSDVRSSMKLPEEMLVMTLRYLSTGMTFRRLAKEHKSTPNRASKIVFSTLKIMWEKLSPIHLREPSSFEISSLVNDYYKKWKFPNCVGTIGGKYVRILKNSSEVSRKVILNVVVDANFKFLCVHLIKNLTSGLQAQGVEDSYKYVFKITGMECLPGTDIMLPLFIIGNDAYPLKSFLMKPYPLRISSACEKKTKFNSILNEARVPVDYAFEILTEKWKIFERPLPQDYSEAKLITRGTCLLHNIIKDKDGDNDPHFSKFGEIDHGVIYLNLVKHKSRSNNRASTVAISIRDQLCDYFNMDHPPIN